MTVPRGLNRKARIAIAAAAMLFVAAPLLAIRNCVSSAQVGSHPVATAHPIDDGLLRLRNGATVFLQDRALYRKLSAWLELDSTAKSAFEIADSNFAPNSTVPTSDGRARLAQVAQVLKADPQLRAQIAFREGDVADVSSEQLEQARAVRIRFELLEEDVPASSVAPLTQPVPRASADHVIDDSGQQSHLIVVLSR